MTSNPEPTPAPAPPQTPTILPINLKQAQAHGWRPAHDLAFVRQVQMLPAVVGEIGALVPNAPLAFARLAADRYTFVMLCGFADGRNQLVDEQGRWALQVLPLELQAYPFALQTAPSTPDGAEPQYTLCFNHGSGLYRESPDATAGEQRFFNDDAQPQPALQGVIERLQLIMGQQRLTQRAVEALQQQELLLPWQIQPREGHPDEVLPQGLYRIDEPKLSALKGDALQALHQVHALTLAYGQLFSMSRISVLQRLKDLHAAARLRSQANADFSAPKAPDLAVVGQIFDAPLGDTLKFPI